MQTFFTGMSYLSYSFLLKYINIENLGPGTSLKKPGTSAASGGPSQAVRSDPINR